ncbi:MAG: threonylcarbamoyl-AMP synthase [Muribaculaceae bacterium]|nr:threonylcarbamoyl-AMP synthase [Muribaculaceae bacterium]
MKVIETKGSGVDRRILMQAVEALRNGDIIIYPTDTLYALGCDALNNRAIERLCHIKGLNPDKNYLSAVFSDLSQVAEYARIDNIAFRILKHYLPGPYTFILPAATSLPKVFKGRKSIGVRIPDCEFARALAEELGNPVLTSSVADSPADFGNQSEVVLAIDSGECVLGPSTVVDLIDSRSPVVVREGSGSFDF